MEKSEGRGGLTGGRTSDMIGRGRDAVRGGGRARPLMMMKRKKRRRE